MFDFLENCIFDLRSDENVSVCILSDLNARTGTLDDCLSIDGEHDNMDDSDITHEQLGNLNI